MMKKAYDVVVIGAGFAGLTAAIEARLAGADVLIVEKMRAIGGNSIISDGGMAVPGTKLQKQAGIDDSPDLMYQDIIRAGLGLNNPRLVRTLVDNALDAFSWAVDYLDVKFLDRVDLFGGHSVPRNHAAAGITGASIIRPMKKKAVELGVDILLGAVFRGFVTMTSGDGGGTSGDGGNGFADNWDGDRNWDGDGGRRERRINPAVAGVDIQTQYDFRSNSGASVERIRAHSVVLATGGFGADVRFRSIQDPRLTEEIDTTNKPVATAEGLISALRLGAVPVQLSHIQLGPWGSPDEKGFGNGPLFADYIGFIHGIIVNPDTGKRFVDERSDRKTVSDAILAVGKPCICVADNAVVENSGWDLSKAINSNVVRRFASIRSLSDAYDIPPAQLGETIGKSNVDAGSLPFYAMRVWPKVHFTMGGVGIDEMARVLDLHGNPIPGLFAAGEVTGGVHGASRLGSCAITECLVFGRIAGTSAADRSRLTR